MLPTIPVFMEVRPFQVSHLCFEVGGILQASFVELGTTVEDGQDGKISPFDFGNIYAFFRKAETSGQTGRLTLDSTNIDLATQNFNSQTPPPVLATLRAEAQRAALDKAINVRSNAFITKYSGIAAIADVMRKILPLRGQSINLLSKLSSNITADLEAAYAGDGDRSGVVTTTLTHVETNGTNKGTLTTNDGEPTDPVSTQTSSTTAHEGQDVTAKSVEFRAPRFENQARNERAQISLGQEVISFVEQTHYLDRLEVVFANELAAIDADINRLQVAYLSTILLSPIFGTITGVYKYPGDSVRGGEPVFRIENDDIVLIVANVVCRGPVLIGHILSIKTTLFDGTGSPVPINAAIVSARGQGDDDQWEVIGKVSNFDVAGKKIFPLGYRFDIDSAITQVSILAPNEI